MIAFIITSIIGYLLVLFAVIMVVTRSLLHAQINYGKDSEQVQVRWRNGTEMVIDLIRWGTPAWIIGSIIVWYLK